MAGQGGRDNETKWATRRHPIRDNETKTDSLKSVSDEEKFEDLYKVLLKCKKIRQQKFLGLAAIEVSIPVHLPFLSGLSYRRIEGSNLLAAPRANNSSALLDCFTMGVHPTIDIVGSWPGCLFGARLDGHYEQANLARGRAHSTNPPG